MNTVATGRGIRSSVPLLTSSTIARPVGGIAVAPPSDRTASIEGGAGFGKIIGAPVGSVRVGSAELLDEGSSRPAAAKARNWNMRMETPGATFDESSIRLF